MSSTPSGDEGNTFVEVFWDSDIHVYFDPPHSQCKKKSPFVGLGAPDTQPTPGRELSIGNRAEG